MFGIGSHRVLAALFSLIAIIGSHSRATAGYVYIRSTVGNPWGQTSNQSAMDVAFGAGNWSTLRYETAQLPTLFSDRNSFIYMEGSDTNANELESFLTINQSAIHSWVANGGSLFLNAAPNEGNGMNLGFDGVSLNFPDYTLFASATDAAHPIFNGPNATSTFFMGNAFAHGSISGSDLTPLIRGLNGDVVLAEKSYGRGHVIFGSMTTTNFHYSLNPALNLRANILTYGADQSVVQNNPEPTSLALAAIGALTLAGFRGLRRNSRPRTAVVV